MDNYVENCDPPTQRGQAAPKESNSLRRLFNGGSPVGWEACAGGRHVEVRPNCRCHGGSGCPSRISAGLRVYAACHVRVHTPQLTRMLPNRHEPSVHGLRVANQWEYLHRRRPHHPPIVARSS